MRMVERHRGIERNFHPEWQRRLPDSRRRAIFLGYGYQSRLRVIRKEAGAPLVKKKEPDRKGIKHTPLSNEHRKSNALPRDVICTLVIQELERLKNGIARQPAIEKKRSYPEVPTPAIESIECRDRSNHSYPNESANNVDSETGKDCVEYVN